MLLLNVTKLLNMLQKEKLYYCFFFESLILLVRQGH
jgi:hypothetical protein